jgi:hypothetical protein
MFVDSKFQQNIDGSRDHYDVIVTIRLCLLGRRWAPADSFPGQTDAVNQPTFADRARQQHPEMYEPVTAAKALNDCCTHLLTAIGLDAMYPERAAQLRAAAGPAEPAHCPAVREKDHTEDAVGPGRFAFGDRHSDPARAGGTRAGW